MPFGVDDAIMVGAVAAPVLGGILGNNAAAGDRAAAQAAYERAYAQFNNIDIPDIEKQKLALQQLTLQGVLNPQTEQAVDMGPSQMQGITTDPRLQQAQMNALQTISKMGEQGLTAEDLAALNQARRGVSADAQARNASILQNMAARGMGSSGASLAAQLASSQKASDIANQQTDQTMAMAQKRMLEAAAQAGTLGGQIRSQAFGEQAAKAQAADAIAQFNAQQQAATQQRNIAAINAAHAQNLAEKQRVADTNTAQANAQQQYNKQLLQQQFGNQMGLASARSNALVGQGQQLQNQANQQAGTWTGIGSGIGQGLLGYEAIQNKKPNTGV